MRTRTSIPDGFSVTALHFFFYLEKLKISAFRRRRFRSPIIQSNSREFYFLEKSSKKKYDRIGSRSRRLLLSSHYMRSRGIFNVKQKVKYENVFPTGISFGFGKGHSLKPFGTYSARHPIIFGSIIAALKTGFADWLTQTYVENTEIIDWRRVSMFTTFGLIYLGGVSYFLYVP